MRSSSGSRVSCTISAVQWTRTGSCSTILDQSRRDAIGH
jgi:hypothetical protein